MVEGYSGTPLTRKLGLKDGMVCALVDPPEHYWDLHRDLPGNLSVVDASASDIDFLHLFVRERQDLREVLSALRQRINQNGMIWVSWPKKASKVPTDVNREIVRQAGPSAGLVDIKVCAIDETWSGLKFVIPQRDRA